MAHAVLRPCLFASLRRAVLAAAAAALAACATLETPAGAPGRPATAAESGTPAAPAGSPASPASGGRLKPMPLKTFTVSTQCRFRDETGNFGNATVDVQNSKVNALKVELTLPRRGSCRFDLAQFRQTQALPSIELASGRNCRIHMWEQGDQITLAFSECHQFCTPGSTQDYVWPILIDKPTGRCD